MKAELYLLDFDKEEWAASLNSPIDGYQSFTWTEHYADVGSFSLTLPLTDQNRRRLELGSFIHNTKSDRICRVETIRYSDESGLIMTVEGRTLEYLLDYRIIDSRDRASYNTGLSLMGITTNQRDPTVIIRNLITQFLSSSSSTEEDIFGRYNMPYNKRYRTLPGGGSYHPKAYTLSMLSDIFGDEEVVYYQFERGKTVLETLRELSLSTGAGFHLSYNLEQDRYMTGNVKAPRVYGADRTSKHEYFGDPISFRVSDGVLINNEKVISTVDYVNGIYSTTRNNNRTDRSGFSRILNPNVPAIDSKYIYSHHDPMEGEDQVSTDDLIHYQRLKVKEHARQTILSSELNLSNPLTPKYREDYLIGDIVNVEDILGEVHRARVVSYTFLDSAEDGYNEIPTFDYVDLVGD